MVLVLDDVHLLHNSTCRAALSVLRLLPLLCTHLTTQEIAAELSLSPHTIKSQTKSVYRKLEASSRHQAVTRSRELGLVDG